MLSIYAAHCPHPSKHTLPTIASISSNAIVVASGVGAALVFSQSRSSLVHSACAGSNYADSTASSTTRLSSPFGIVLICFYALALQISTKIHTDTYSVYNIYIFMVHPPKNRTTLQTLSCLGMIIYQAIERRVPYIYTYIIYIYISISEKDVIRVCVFHVYEKRHFRQVSTRIEENAKNLIFGGGHY